MAAEEDSRTAAAKLSSIAAQLGEVASSLPSLAEREAKVVAFPSRRSGASIARGMLKARQNLRDVFPAGLFADPAFEMLLDLFAAGEEGEKITVTSLCIASGVPLTTALRWITVLETESLIVREKDAEDARRVVLTLTPAARMLMHSWLVRNFAAGSQAAP